MTSPRFFSPRTAAIAALADATGARMEDVGGGTGSTAGSGGAAGSGGTTGGQSGASTPGGSQSSSSQSNQGDKSGQQSRRDPGEEHLDGLLNGTADTSSKGSDSSSGGSETSSREGESSGQGESGGPVTLDQVQKMIEGMGQSIADRLVNAQGKQARKAGQRQQQEQGEGEQQGQGGLSEADLREARQELRFELREHRPRGASDAERDLGEALGERYLSHHLADGLAPDRAARQAAKKAADELESFARKVREQTVASLRKRGALAEGAGQGQGGGSAAAGVPGQPSNVSSLESANRARAEAFNQTAGHTA